MCVTDLFSLISSLGIIIATILAIKGINAWKEEMRFRRKYELAELILTNAYEAVDVINSIRFPVSKKDEGISRKKGDNELPNQTEYLNRLYVVKERFYQKNECYKRLFSVRYNVKVIFSPVFEKHFNTILRMPHKIFTAVDEYAETVINPQYYKEDDVVKIRGRYNRAVYGNLTKKVEDSIYNEMKNALDSMEAECREYLK